MFGLSIGWERKRERENVKKGLAKYQEDRNDRLWLRASILFIHSSTLHSDAVQVIVAPMHILHTQIKHRKSPRIRYSVNSSRPFLIVDTKDQYLHAGKMFAIATRIVLVFVVAWNDIRVVPMSTLNIGIYILTEQRDSCK